ncbi:MAG: hypothetical protein U5K33_01945 [Halofilum sp. (in: g-proteobacteria)]|nr:hypothetical protein [Halofilum sp. (in: g-proteobacteria)]
MKYQLGQLIVLSSLLVTLGITNAAAAIIATDEQNDVLMSINSVTGDVTEIGSLTVDTGSFLDFQFIRSIADVNGTLYGVDVKEDERLVTIDKTNADVSVVGKLQDPDDSTVNFGSVGGLAYDALSNILYGVDEDSLNNDLVRIDPLNGFAKNIGKTGNADVRSLAFVDNWLYGVDAINGDLLKIDPSTGAGTLVGSLFGGITSKVEALTYDTENGKLLGFDSTSDSLLEIDILTGAASPLVTLSGGGNVLISGMVGTLDFADDSGDIVVVSSPGTWPLLILGLTIVVAVHRSRFIVRG